MSREHHGQAPSKQRHAPLGDQTHIAPIWGLGSLPAREFNDVSIDRTMTSSKSRSPRRIRELESSYPLYYKAMRILIRDGITKERIRNTVCWNRLEVLHGFKPTQYPHPKQISMLLWREIRDPIAATDAHLAYIT